MHFFEFQVHRPKRHDDVRGTLADVTCGFVNKKVKTIPSCFDAK